MWEADSPLGCENLWEPDLSGDSLFKQSRPPHKTLKVSHKIKSSHKAYFSDGGLYAASGKFHMVQKDQMGVFSCEIGC
jgi:hypothetical protein